MAKSIALRLLVAALAFAALGGDEATGAAPEPPWPEDALALLCVPEAGPARSAWQSSSLGRFWADPALQPFRDKLRDNWSTQIVATLERDLGSKFSDWERLAQGRLSLAVLANGWPTQPHANPAWVLLVDTGTNAGEARLRLNELAVAQLGRGRGVRTLRVRELEVQGFPANWRAAARRTLTQLLGLPSPPAAPDVPATNAPPSAAGPLIWAGCTNNLLLVSDNTNALDRVLAGLDGLTNSAHALSPDTSTQSLPASATPLLHGWVDLQPFTQWLRQRAERVDQTESSDSKAFPMPKRTKLLSASGFDGLHSVAFAWAAEGSGIYGEFHLQVPAARRRGIVKAFEWEPADAAPPDVVPAESVRYERIRLDAKRTWRVLEATLTDVFPQAAGVLRLLFETGGPANERVDLREELLAGLGNDFVMYALPGETHTAPVSAPLARVYLVGSTNAGKLVAAVKALSYLLPPPLAEIREVTLDGRTVQALRIQDSSGLNLGAGITHELLFAAGPNHGVFATSARELERCLSTNPAAPARLSTKPGFAAAAERVGGTQTGLFGYEDLARALRPAWEALRQNTNTAARALPFGHWLPSPEGKVPAWPEWVDFSQLPPFEVVARHFDFSVYSGRCDTNGFHYRVHVVPAPTAP